MNAQIALDLTTATVDASGIADAISQGLQTMTESAETIEAPAKNTRKAPAKDTTTKATKTTAKEPKGNATKAVTKAAPIVFKAASGQAYELTKGANPSDLKKDVAELTKALTAIDKKDSDLLGHYLSLGKFQSKASKLFKSVKLYGQFLAQELPASQKLDPALRSNCKWLFEALNVEGAEASDILNVLQVNRIEDYKSKNPTVIRRDYKAAKDELERVKAAEELGVSLEELDKQEEAEAQAKVDELKELVAEFARYVITHPEIDLAEKELRDVLTEVFTGKKKDAAEMINSLLPVAEAE